jgi:adenylate cyclase
MKRTGRARVERRLAAILAADVAGYSRLMGEDEEGTLTRLKARRRELIDPKTAEHRGRIVKTTGDGLLIEFPSIVEAVSCALAVQRAMAERDATMPEIKRIAFRVGVHLGDIIVEDGDIHGDGVNIAARLEGIAEPGSICISEDALRQVRGKVEAEFIDTGEQSLKNITRPIRVYRVVPERLVETWHPGLPLPDKPSIAVLPFQNISGDAEQEYFADGMVEEITTALSKVRWFFVIARNSSFTYKGRAVDVKQVGRELGVRYVLEGSVRKAGNRVRINAQLVDAEIGNHIWAERYDRKLADIFALQDEITERVAATIEPQLYAAENFRTQRKPPENLDAWECMIRALSYFGQGTRVGNTEAEALCRRAIAIAPSYGQAHSLLAWALARRPMWSGEVGAVLPEAIAEARAALGLDERDPWAHMTHGMVLFRMRRHSEAVRAHRRALELNPNFALAHVLLGLPLAVEGMHEDAIKSAEHAMRLSPGDRLVEVYAAHTLKLAHFASGDYARAAASAQDALEIYPESHWAYECIVAATAMQGDMGLAVETLKILLHLQPDFSIAWVLQNSGISGEMRERYLEGLRKAGVPEE